jgi:hypothetical protein
MTCRFTTPWQPWQSPQRRRLNDANKQAMAQALYNDASSSIADICQTPRVTRSTLYHDQRRHPVAMISYGASRRARRFSINETGRDCALRETHDDFEGHTDTGRFITGRRASAL